MRSMTLQEVQNVSLEILKDVHFFCESHNIRYSIHYGTLIGAIRHKGFIPWDDDIDIVMPRPDYERFCKEYQSSNNYTLYLPGDSGYYLTYPRVCDNERTMVLSNHPGAMDKTGVWIDILPLDGLPSDEAEFQSLVKEIRKIHPKMYRLRTGKFLKLSETVSFKDLLSCIIKRIIYFHYNIYELVNQFTQLISSCDYEKSDFCGQLCSADYPEKEHNPKSDFESYELKQFCDMEFYVMNGYDNVLRRYFGNYMELPPEDQRHGHDNNIYYWK